MDNNIIRKEDIFNYSYYDDCGKLITVLNEQFLKDYFQSDVVLKEYNPYIHTKITRR